MGLARGCDAITVGISQPVQPVLAVPLMLRKMGDLLLTPGSAVRVFEHDLHPYSTPLRPDESHGNPRQRQLLNRHLHALFGYINGSDQELFQVIAVAPLVCQR